MAGYANPSVLRWARERRGLSVESVAKSLHREPAVVTSWETGAAAPSYAVLERLAASHYKVPVAVFYFPEPPDIEDPVARFRRLPDYERERFSPDTLHKVRLLQAYQVSLRQLMPPGGPAKRIADVVRPSVNDDTRQVARRIREYAGVDLSAQIASSSAERALKLWRHALEGCGVFTFKDTLNDRFISGLCLLDPEYPVVLVNNSTSFTRQLFTLLHELSHILYRVHGVTDESEEYFSYLEPQQRRIEILSNQLAAEVLVPSAAFNEDAASVRRNGLSAVSMIADKYCVSREVILRRLLDLGLVTTEYYQKAAAEMAADYKRLKGASGHGNFYLTRLAYLGEGFAKLALSHYRTGRLSPQEVAVHLNINSRHLGKLETYLG